MECWDRQKLYEEVWAKPVTKVAARYGVSDVMIAKICRKLSIPLPGRGYWARLAAGQKITRTPLPKVKDVPVIYRYETVPENSAPQEPKPPVPEPTDPEYLRINAVESRTIAVDSFEKRHKLILAAEKRLSGAKVNSDGILEPRGSGPLLEMRISPGALDRALAIMNAIILTLEAERFSVALEGGLARANREKRVLLTTFSEPLANSLRGKLKLLLSKEPRLGDQIEVHSMDTIGLRLYEVNIQKAKLATRVEIEKLIQKASQAAGEHKFSLRFLVTEWEQVVDAWQLDTWEEYRDVQRLGRRTRLKEPQRKLLWSIFEGVRSALREAGAITSSGMFNVLARHYRAGAPAPYDHCVVDEAQDISIAQLRFLAAIGGSRSNGLFFAGDLGQRIFQQPFSWKAAGVDVRGRSTMLKINYRTSHQIRSQADRLLESHVQDVDGNVEDRKGTISLFDGPKPDIKTFNAEADEIACVRDWLNGLTAAGLRPHEIALFARSAAQLNRPTAAVAAAGLAPHVLDEHVEIKTGKVSIGTMHLAKGLEFRAVGVMACDDEVIPLQERIETVTDDGDLEDVYNTERQLLYVACTRARDHLLVTGTDPASEFLDDLGL